MDHNASELSHSPLRDDLDSRPFVWPRFERWLFLKLSILLAFSSHTVTAASVPASILEPTVILDDATVTGVFSGFVNKFLGIPFAQPPVGDLRLRLPKPLPPYSTSFSAKAYGPACPQQELKLPLPSFLPAETVNLFTNSIYKLVTPSAEDCLTLNVVAPVTATPESKLPVVVWIFGGGFTMGGTNVFDGGVIVDKSILLGVPAVYVSMNYRLNAFGFLASKEVKEAGVGNLGLQDQRLALQWVQKYITAFGGDPTKVTIWGESAGAVSVALHMVSNGGNPNGLFRAAFMESGSPIPVGPITNGQPDYDSLVAETGCSGSTDTLQCLREAPYETLLKAVNRSPGIFSYQAHGGVSVWFPRVDGVFLKDHPQRLVQRGSVANVPFITGDCDDEGTLFSLSTLNVTTDAQFEEYIRTYWLPNASDTEVTRLLSYYPSDPSRGSPFGTGDLYGIAQFKRFAALQGDVALQAPRRFFIQNRSEKQRIWTYVSKRLKLTPFLGSFHASDILNVYTGQDMTSYLVRFASNLDPNVGLRTDIFWPQYDTVRQTMLEFKGGFFSQSLTTDTYRAEEMAFLTNLTFLYPL